MARMYSIDNTYVRDCVRAGYTQHVAFMFPGSPFEIIGDERIAHENGFTLNEYFCHDTDYTPGQVCSPKLTSTLLNYDGALVGFNYERDFMMLVGVEKNAGTNVSFGTPASSGDYHEFLELNGVQYALGNGVLSRTVNGVQTTTNVGADTHMFAVRGNESTETYYLYVVRRQSEQYTYKNIFKIDADGTVTMMLISGFAPTAYMYARLEELAAQNTCEVWDFKASAYSAICHKFIRTDNSGNVTRHDILFEYYHVLSGKQPRRTLGDIVTFDADGIASRLDTNADAYADTVFSSSRNLKTIRDNLLSAVGLVGGLSYSPETSVYFTQNPFAGMHGYTYRDFLALVGESIGKSLRASSRSIGTTVSNNVPTGITISCVFQWGTFSSLSLNSIVRSDYYTYDAEEYTVQAIGLVVSKQTDSDIGVSYPDASGEQNTHIIVNNPLLALDSASVIKSRLSYVFSAMTATGNTDYTPAVIEMPSWLYFEPGDLINVTLEDGTTAKVPIFCMTTTWNGGADCTIECTGNKVRNQYERRDFRETLKSGGKIHEVIVDIEQSYSQIMDTLTQDYSTTQQTSSMISLYVGNHAYEKVSGITITSLGVDISGSKYVKLSSNGYISCAENWIFDQDGIYFRGQSYTQGGTSYIPILRFGDNTELYSTTVQYDKDNNQVVAGVGFVNETGYDETLSQTVRLNSLILGVTTPAWSQNYASVGLRLRAMPGSHRMQVLPYAHDAGNNAWYIDLGSGGVKFSGIYGSSIVASTSVSSPQYITTSSRDVKHDITPLDNMGDLIDKLVPVTFVYNEDETERKHYGLIHEDTIKVLPGVCVGNEYTDAKDKAINYVEIIPILLKEIQSLRSRVKELEQKNVQN